MQRDDDGFEVRCYRVVWFFEIGTIGDSEGRTWAKDLKHQSAHASQKEAETAMADHPGTYQDKWGGWRAVDSYGLVRVRRAEVLIETH